jgi:CBS domain-containing protein
VKPVIEILQSKAIQTLFAVEPETTVLEAAKMMAEHNVGALLVMRGERVVGIVSERDYVRRIAAAERSAHATTCEQIMTREVKVVSPDTSDEECMALMTQGRLRHLPVVVRGQVIGVISIGDLVKDIISEQQFMIEQLHHYIVAG